MQTETVTVSDTVVADPCVVVEASVNHDGTSQPTGLQLRQHLTGLRLQRKLATMDCADHSVSYSMYQNAAISEDILTFTGKARLQVLLWYPANHDPLN